MLQVKDLMQEKVIYRDQQCAENPEISVVMPVYCHNGSLLRRAVESVLNQTFLNFELLIIDDGSRDGTFKTVMEYANRDKRIVVIRHEWNCGLSAVRMNEAVMESRGKYIAYQFDDDEYLPNCLMDLYSEIIRHEEPCVVYGKTKMITLDKNGQEQLRYIGEPFNYAHLHHGNCIANNAVLYHKSIMYKVGLYDPHVLMRRLCDYDLWRRMGKQVPFYHIPQNVTVVYAGQNGSLGKTIAITSMASTRKYMEIERDSRLLPEVIMEYSVDTIDPLLKYFDSNELELLYRREIFPFLNKNTYWLTLPQKQGYAVYRNKIRNLLVIKSEYSTSVDVAIKNFLQRSLIVPYTFSFINAQSYGIVRDYSFDLAIFYRSISQQETKYLEYCKKAGIATAYWIDDNMFRFHEDGPEFAYLAPDGDNYKRLEKLVASCDEIVSYSPSISADCQPYNKRILELTTNIPAQYLKRKEAPQDDKIHFAVFTGNVRRGIFAKLWGALERISREYPDRMDITFWGLDPAEYSPLGCNVFHEPFTHSYDKYLHKLEKSQFHYQICPLERERATDQSKSPIKYLEGTAAGCVSLFSNNPPYQNLPDACCIKVENTEDDWYDALKQSIELPEPKRYAIYERALTDIQKRFTTEAQSVKFITVLDTALLHQRLGNKKIAYLIHESYLGGATLHLLRHALLMRSLHFDILLCLPEQYRNVPDFPEHAKQYGINEVFYLPCRRSLQPVNRTKQDDQDAVKIAEFLQNHNVGLMHSATYFPAVGIATGQMGIPNVATLHQYYPNLEGFQNDSNIQIIHSSSNRYANEWQSVLNTPAYRIVCPVDQYYFNLFEKNLEYAPVKLKKGEQTHILLSGTLQPRKNQLEGIYATDLLRRRGYDITLTLIGYDTLAKDYVHQCQDEIKRLGLENVVHIHGFDAHPETYYDQNCQILLCSAENESMPQTILQAMAAGIFVVSTDCGGITEIIKNNYNGIISGGMTGRDLAEAIERLLNMELTMQTELLCNAHETIQAIASEKFVRSELVYLYLRAFERCASSSNRKVEIPVNNTSSVVKTPQQMQLFYTAREYELPLLAGSNLTETLGGHNLSGKRRKYDVIMRTGCLSGLKFWVATLGKTSAGILRARLYSSGEMLHTKDFEMDQYGAYGELTWNFVPISAPSGTKLILELEYLPASKEEWLCVYERRLPLTLVNRLLYKMNFKSSYALEGYGYFE